jgi:hypothetical protein
LQLIFNNKILCANIHQDVDPQVLAPARVAELFSASNAAVPSRQEILLRQETQHNVEIVRKISVDSLKYE